MAGVYAGSGRCVPHKSRFGAVLATCVVAGRWLGCVGASQDGESGVFGKLGQGAATSHPRESAFLVRIRVTRYGMGYGNRLLCRGAESQLSQTRVFCDLCVVFGAQDTVWGIKTRLVRRWGSHKSGKPGKQGEGSTRIRCPASIVHVGLGHVRRRVAGTMPAATISCRNRAQPDARAAHTCGTAAHADARRRHAKVTGTSRRPME